jgi:diadenosine tetraphosphate (Ap4A) HIT family hydrolase
MSDVFCKIVKGEIPAVKIWENNEFLAFLDLNPNTEGMTLVIPKEHYDSDINEMPDDVLCKFFLAAKEVSKILERGLKVQRVSIVVEGMGVNHAHIKLYPLHGLDKKFTEMWGSEKVYFKNYPGYLTTLLGPQRTDEELQKVAEKIKSANQ